MAEQRTLDAERAELYPKAVAIVKEQKRASVSLVQRRLRLSWDTARDLVELMLERKDVPVEWAPVVYQLAARRAPPALDTEGLPPLPEPVDTLAAEDGFNVIGEQGVYTAEQVRQAMRDAVAADRRAHGKRLISINEDVGFQAALVDLMCAAQNGLNVTAQSERVQALTDVIDAALARQSAPEGAPVGMALVPVEPTDEMVVAFAETWFSKVRPIDDCGMEDCYAAMLAAAPTSASVQPAEGGA
jgi:hypothetical protein